MVNLRQPNPCLTVSKCNLRESALLQTVSDIPHTLRILLGSQEAKTSHFSLPTVRPRRPGATLRGHGFDPCETLPCSPSLCFLSIILRPCISWGYVTRDFPPILRLPIQTIRSVQSAVATFSPGDHLFDSLLPTFIIATSVSETDISIASIPLCFPSRIKLSVLHNKASPS